MKKNLLSNGDTKVYDVKVKDLLCIPDESVYKRRYWTFSDTDILNSQEAHMEWEKYSL